MKFIILNIFCLFTKCSSFSPETEDVGNLILDDQHWTKAQLDIIGRPENVRATRGMNTKDRIGRWPGDLTSDYLVIPYRFENESYFSESIKDLIKDTMDEISENHLDGCIRWTDDTETKQYKYWINLLNKGKGTGCWSNVGYLGDVKNQKLNLAPECWTVELIIHEFLHSMGFQHEHERPDRDEYITVHWDRIQDNRQQYFQKMSPENWGNTESGYDINSIMHFPDYAFRTEEAGSKGLPVMTLIATGERVQFPRVKTMPRTDNEQLRNMYANFCPNAVFRSGENGALGNASQLAIFVLLSYLV